MAFAGINYLAILIAAGASFLFGGVWYGILSQQWMAAVGKSEADIKSGTSMPLLFGLTIIAQLIMAWVLAGLIGHLGQGQVTLRNGMISAAFCWFGFVLTTLVVNHGYQGSRRALTVIDGLHWLGVLLIQGAIIGWMGVR
ncbi:MAG TPA: DUF1761 domain-containing protein [Hyphomicrobiaceae bacterium]|nr:DUF1761 domain-containing protein [Hyphomicrobiaceae bacterium]